MDAGQIITDSSWFVYGRLCSLDRNLFNYIILSEVYLCPSWLSSYTGTCRLVGRSVQHEFQCVQKVCNSVTVLQCYSVTVLQCYMREAFGSSI